MQYILVLSLILVSASSSAFAQFTFNRELSKYDDGGVFEFSMSKNQQQQDEMRAEIRHFIWAQWSKKRRGYLQITFWSAAEDPSTYNLYIEPQKGNEWQITSEYKRQCCGEQVRRDPARGIEINTGTLYYVTLERRETIPGIEFAGEDYPLDKPLYGKPVPLAAKRPGGTFILLFRHEKQGQADWML